MENINSSNENSLNENQLAENLNKEVLKNLDIPEDRKKDVIIGWKAEYNVQIRTVLKSLSENYKLDESPSKIIEDMGYKLADLIYEDKNLEIQNKIKEKYPEK